MAERKTKASKKKAPRKAAASSTRKSGARKAASKSARGTRATKTASRKTSRAAAKKPAQKKSTARKAPKKAATKSSARKAPAKKTASKRAASRPARKAPAAKKAATKRAKKPAASKKTVKKAPAKAAAKKSSSRKPAQKKAAAKAAAKKAPAKKPAAPKKAAKPARAPAKRTPARTPKTNGTATRGEPAVKETGKAKSAKAPPTTVAPVTPVVKPLPGSAAGRPTSAPAPSRVREGAVDAQLVSALHYGVFAAINKTFGRFGESMVKNASLRFLEYGYKKGWLPPTARDPLKALNEFLGRLQAMGYADRLRASKSGDGYVCEAEGLSDWEAVSELRELHYPLLPVLLPEIIHAFLNQYFQLVVVLEPTEIVNEKQGLRVPFTMHERQKDSGLSNLPERPSLAYYDLEE